MNLVISRHLVFVKFIDIPSLEEDEIARMVEFQAAKEIPHPKEDLIISYRNIGSYQNGFSSVMLAAATRDMIEEKIRQRSHLNIQTGHIRLSSELLYLFLLKKGILKHDKVSLVVHIGKDASEIMIVDRGRLIFSRGFKNSERFLQEIDRSILAYRRDKDNPGVDDVIITYPQDVDMQDAAPSIKEHFSAPLVFYEYNEDLVSLDLPAQVDLLPKEVTYKRVNLQKRREYIVTYSLVGFIIILFFAFFSFKLYEKKKFVGALSADLNKMQSRIQGLDKYLKKTGIIKNHIKDGNFIGEALERSYMLMPQDITISAMDYNGKGSMFYKGTAKGMSFIVTFVKKLEGLRYFKKVEVRYATKKIVRGEELTDFNIRCQLAL